MEIASSQFIPASRQLLWVSSAAIVVLGFDLSEASVFLGLRFENVPERKFELLFYSAAVLSFFNYVFLIRSFFWRDGSGLYLQYVENLEKLHGAITDTFPAFEGSSVKLKDATERFLKSVEKFVATVSSQIEPIENARKTLKSQLKEISEKTENFPQEISDWVRDVGENRVNFDPDEYFGRHFQLISDRQDDLKKFVEDNGNYFDESSFEEQKILIQVAIKKLEALREREDNFEKVQNLLISSSRSNRVLAWRIKIFHGALPLMLFLLSTLLFFSSATRQVVETWDGGSLLMLLHKLFYLWF